MEHTNPDLAANYCPEGSYDLNDDDPDPMPDFDKCESMWDGSTVTELNNDEKYEGTYTHNTEY